MGKSVLFLDQAGHYAAFARVYFQHYANLARLDVETRSALVEPTLSIKKLEEQKVDLLRLTHILNPTEDTFRFPTGHLDLPERVTPALLQRVDIIVPLDQGAALFAQAFMPTLKKKIYPFNSHFGEGVFDFKYQDLIRFVSNPLPMESAPSRGLFLAHSNRGRIHDQGPLTWPRPMLKIVEKERD